MLNKKICRICINQRRVTANDTSNPDLPSPWCKTDEEEWHRRALVFCLSPNWVADVRKHPPTWCAYRVEQILDTVDRYDFDLQEGYENPYSSGQSGRKQIVPILDDLGLKTRKS